MIGGVQIKMARAALGLGMRELAELADVDLSTINRVEGGGGMRVDTMQKIQKALESAGVVFLPENGNGPGVALKKDQG